MATTTSYGTWVNHGDRGNLTVEATVTDAVNGGDSDWRDRLETTGAFGRIVADYRDAIQAALPQGVFLTGNEFIGPWRPEEGEFDGYPADEYGDLDLSQIIDGVDLEPIIARHDPDHS